MNNVHYTYVYMRYQEIQGNPNRIKLNDSEISEFQVGRLYFSSKYNLRKVRRGDG